MRVGRRLPGSGIFVRRATPSIQLPQQICSFLRRRRPAQASRAAYPSPAMPTRELLAPSQRAQFTELPTTFDDRTLSRFYTLSEQDLQAFHALGGLEAD